MALSNEEKDEIRRQNPLEVYLPKRGFDLKKEGRELVCVCPFHKEKTGSFNVNVEKQVFLCRGCAVSGDVFSFVQKLDGLSFLDAAEKLAGRPLRDSESPGSHRATQGAAPKQQPAPPAEKAKSEPLPPPTATYSYTDAAGVEVCQALRFVLANGKKTFRQRQKGPEGKWVWNLDGIVETPIYRLLAVMAETRVWVVEGEKDVETLEDFGMVATCNPMGAGKWREHHSAFLAGKEVVLCGDNDDPGRAHMDAVEKSLAPYAKFTKRISVPEPHKDLSDFITAAATPEAGMLILYELAMAAPELYRGVDLPFQSMADLEVDYAMTVSREATASVDLARWLPSFRWCVRPLVPGELVTFLAATGVGKTAILQNIAIAIAPLPVLLFELELPGSLTFERFAALATGKPGAEVYSAYQQEDRSVRPNWRASQKLHRVFTSSRSNLTVEQMTRYVNFAHLKLGERPAVVMVDYFGLVSAKGNSRYERMSAVAEELKVMAKATNTVVFACSQIDRAATTREEAEVYLSDGKDSGSIENSSGVVIGAWRDPQDPSNESMTLKILKNTKGKPGRQISCKCDNMLRIVEVTEKAKSSSILPKTQ